MYVMSWYVRDTPVAPSPGSTLVVGLNDLSEAANPSIPKEGRRKPIVLS